MKLTSSKHEEPGDGVGQRPCVSTELEQVVREDVDEPEAEPAKQKEKNNRTGWYPPHLLNMSLTLGVNLSGNKVMKLHRHLTVQLN